MQIQNFGFQNGELFYIILVQNKLKQTSSVYKFGLFRLNNMNNLKRASFKLSYNKLVARSSTERIILGNTSSR